MNRSSIPLSYVFVRKTQMDSLMSEFSELSVKTTEYWKKPKSGETSRHVHVMCWDDKFMCSGCNQDVTDPDRVSSEKEISNRLGAEDLSTPADSVNSGVSIAFWLHFARHSTFTKSPRGKC